MRTRRHVQANLQSDLRRLGSAAIAGLETMGILVAAPAQAATESTPPDAQGALRTLRHKDASASEVDEARRALWKSWTTSEGLSGKLKESIASAAEAIDVRVFTLGGIKDLGIGVRASEKLLKASDPEIQKDPARKAILEKATAAGEPLSFVLLGGGIYPTAGLSASVPLGGPGYATGGFVGNAALTWSVLAPYPASGKAALQAADNLSGDLPIDSTAARRFAQKNPGGEAVFTGMGSLAAFAGVGAGYRLLDLGNVASVRASAGIDVSAGKMEKVSVRVRALDNEKVRVSIAKVGASEHGVAVGASVGLTPTSITDGSDFSRWVYRDAGSIFDDELKNQLDFLRLMDFRADHRDGTTVTGVDSWVLDLKKPEDRTAYDGLIRLDPKAASNLRKASLREAGHHESDGISLDVGPMRLLSSIASRATRHGVVTLDDRKFTYDRADLNDGFSSVFTDWALGKQDITREWIEVSDSQAAAPSRYYHLKYKVEGDGVTSEDDVREFLRLAVALGQLSPAEAAKKEADPAFIDGFGTSDRTVDVYISEAGLNQLAAADQDAILAAHAAAYESLDRPGDISYLIGGNEGVWHTSPWLAKDQPDYKSALSLIVQDASRVGGKSDSGNEGSYRAITGRDLHRDASAYREGRRLLKLLTELSKAEDALGRAETFAAKAEVGLDFGRDLVAMAKLAGPGAVQIAELGIRDTEGGPKLILGGAAPAADPELTVKSMMDIAPTSSGEAIAKATLFPEAAPTVQGSKLFQAIAGQVMKATQAGAISQSLVYSQKNWAEPKALVNPEHIFKEARVRIAGAKHEVDIQNFRWSKDSDPVKEVFSGLQELQQNRMAAGAKEPVKVRLMIDTMQSGLNENPDTTEMFDQIRAKVKEYGLNPKFVDVQLGAHDHSWIGALHSKGFLIDGETLIVLGANLNYFDNWDSSVVRDEPVNNEHDAGFILHGEIARAAVKEFDDGWRSSVVWIGPGGGGPLPSPLPSMSIAEATAHPQKIEHHFDPLPDDERATVPMLLVTKPPHDVIFASNAADHPLNRAVIAMFEQAEHEVDFMTANLNAAPVQDAIVAAAARGVTVRGVLTKGFEDFSEALPGQGGTNAIVVKKLYQRLAKANIPKERLQIRWSRATDTQTEPDVGGEYRSSHVKAVFADRKVSLVTSFNLDTQSWGGSREIGAVIDDAKTTEAWMKQLFDADFKRALPITQPEKLGWDFPQLFRTTHIGE
ncbi:MAG: phosphatidylserine/phosphatidylglycerophosphate/cardiolipin synthase family protein [Myxococcota bacterium]